MKEKNERTRERREKDVLSEGRRGEGGRRENRVGYEVSRKSGLPSRNPESTGKDFPNSLFSVNPQMSLLPSFFFLKDVKMSKSNKK